MRCSTCRAPVSTFERSCPECGAELGVTSSILAPPEPLDRTWVEDGPAGAIAAPDTVAAGGETPIAAAGRRIRVLGPWSTRSTRIVAALAVIAISAAGVLGMSRASVAGRLDSTKGDLQRSQAQLTDARSQIDTLQHQVATADAARDSTQTRLEKSTATAKDTQTSLSACQHLFRELVAIGRGTPPPPQMQAKLTAQLVSCFQGQIPPSLFP